jgi:hypothetical protein
MDQKLCGRLVEILQAGGGEPVGTETYVRIFELGSETRYGLCADETWTAHRPGTSVLVHLGDGTEPHFCEVVECKRAEFEELLAAGARKVGLDPDALTLSFPSVAIVRALLQRESVHYTRLGLLWLLPSELRELRPHILEVAQNRTLPTSVRDLARHLVVPE